MALEFVNNTSGYGAGSATTIAAAAASHTTGNLLVVGVGFYESTGQVNSITDTAGNTYVLILRNAGDSIFEIWYAKNINGHANNVVTATFNSAKTYREMGVQQWSGADISSPYDVSNQGAGTGTSMSTAASTTNFANEVIIAGYYVSDLGTFTAGANFTLRWDGTYMGSESRIVSSAGSYGSAMTYNVWGYWQGLHATFKQASAIYQEDLTSIAVSVSSIQDIQSFIQTLDSAIQSQSTLADLQNYLQTLDSLIQSQSTLTDLQTYKETLESLIQSVSSESDAKAIVEDLQTTIASVSAVTAIQNYVHALDSAAQSAASLSDIQNYIDIVVSTAQSISSIADFKTYTEILDSIMTSVSTISDTIILAETLETQIQSEATLIDIQHYFETLLTTIVSEASVTEVLTGQYVEDLLSTIISGAGVFEEYRKPGMIEATRPFYFDPRPEFGFGDIAPIFRMGVAVPAFIIEKRQWT